MEEWFRRAMKADPGNYSACSKSSYYLEPKWYGSEEEMLAFGALVPGDGELECTTAVRPERMVNFCWPATLCNQEGKIDLKSDKDSKQPKVEYYQRPGVWEDVKAVYEPYLKQFPKAVNDRSMFAKLACWCGRWDECVASFSSSAKSPA